MTDHAAPPPSSTTHHAPTTTSSPSPPPGRACRRRRPTDRRPGRRSLCRRRARYARQGRHGGQGQRQRRQPVHPAAWRHRQAAHGQHRRAVRPRQRRPAHRQPRRRHPARRRGRRHPHRRTREGPGARTATCSSASTGDDINIWAPGDGSDAFVGNEDKDTMIFAPFVRDDRRLTAAHPRARTQDPARRHRRAADLHLHRRAGAGLRAPRLPVPRPVQRQRHPGRDRAAEGRREGLLPQPDAGTAQVAKLDGDDPTSFRTVYLDRIRGTVGDILGPVG